MSWYRRCHCPWGAYWLTIVTHNRYPLFRDEAARQLLGKAMRETFEAYPLTIHEMALLPDHLHILCSVPDKSQNYSIRVQQFKRRFTRLWLAHGGHEADRSISRKRSRERGVWQRRFYEHTIRNQQQLRDHAVYTLMNPVKHKLAKRAADWPWSTIHKHLQNGILTEDWCGPIELPGIGIPKGDI